MKYLYLITCLAITCTCFAQKQNVYFLKNDGRRVFSKDSMDFIRIVREPDSGSVFYNVLEYYPKGQKKRITRSSKIDPVLSIEGQCLEYYANGKTKEIANYKNDKRVGEAYHYFPNGKIYTVVDYGEQSDAPTYQAEYPKEPLIKACNDSLGKVLAADGVGHYVIYDDHFKQVEEEGDIKNGRRTGEWKGATEKGKIKFTEQYADGVLIKGTATDSAGIYTYKTRMIGARYKNGIDAFYRYIADYIEYPRFDRQNGSEGTVLLTFTVTKYGTVKNIKVIRSVTPTIDAEAIKVLQKSKDWLPGIYFGRQADAQFTVPLVFKLSGG
jgi:TonB family protein